MVAAKAAKMAGLKVDSSVELWAVQMADRSACAWVDCSDETTVACLEYCLVRLTVAHWADKTVD